MRSRVLGILIVLSLLIGSTFAPSFAEKQTAEIDNFTVSFDPVTKEATIIGQNFGTGGMEVMTVPHHLGELTVVAIGTSGLFGALTNKIVVEEGITELKDGALQGTLALEIELPSTIKTMGKKVLNGNQRLEKVTFKHDFDEIPEGCFEYCKSLKSTKDVFAPGTVKKIGKGAFSMCFALEEADLRGVEYIGGCAFENCRSLKKVEMDAAKTIEYYAFASCSALESAEIPASVQKIQYSTIFRDCDQLKTLTVNAREVYSLFVNNCPALEEVVFGDSNFSIESGFENCPSLKTIKIGKGTKWLKGKVTDCPALAEIIFAEGSECIVEGNYAEGTAFESDPANTVDGIYYIGNCAVKGKNVSGEVTFRPGTVGVSKLAFINNDEITSVVLPKTMKVLLDGSFCGCNNLVSVKAQGPLEMVGGAFGGCEKLTDIEIPFNQNNYHVFSGAVTFNKTPFAKDPKNLDSSGVLYYGETLLGVVERDYSKTKPSPWNKTRHYSVRPGTVVINDRAFEGSYGYYFDKSADNSLSVTIPEGVVSIGERAFSHAASITSMVIPKSVIYIGDGAFNASSYDPDIIFDDDYDGPWEGLPSEEYYYSAPSDIYYLGTENDWKKIDNHAKIPTNTTVHYAADFKDVRDGKWYASGARYCSARGLMNGTGGGMFSPNAKLTRAMFVTMLAKLAKADLTGYKAGRFTDVPSGKWYTKAVSWAAENGYTAGTGKNVFSPNKTVTREELAQFLYTYAKKNGKDVSASADISRYKDAGRVSGWAVNSMKWAVGAGMISGTSAAVLSPGGTATRAQAAVILMQFAQNIID